MKSSRLAGTHRRGVPLEPAVPPLPAQKAGLQPVNRGAAAGCPGRNRYLRLVHFFLRF